jgi:hypothetical protein
MRPTIPAALMMSLGALSLPVLGHADEPRPSPPPAEASPAPPATSPPPAAGPPAALAPVVASRVPPPLKEPTPAPEHNSEGRMVVGALLSILGGIGSVPGWVLLSNGISTSKSGNDDDNVGGALTGIGILILGISGILVAVGIPIFVNGAKPKAAPPPAAPKWASTILTLAGGTRTVGLRWSF